MFTYPEDKTQEEKLDAAQSEYTARDGKLNVVLLELKVLGLEKNILSVINIEVIRQGRFIDVLVVVGLADEVDHGLNGEPE